MRLRNALLAATLLTAVSGAALAQGNQHPKGFYVGGALGANITGDLDAKINSTSLGVNNNDLTFDMKTGYAILGAVGYAYGNGLRTEIEPGYRRNSIDGISGAAAAANLSGKLENLSVMLNAIYDINIGSALVPYLGAGLGTSRVNGKVDGEGDSKWKLAYQGIAGVAYSLNNQVKLDLGYRYFATPDVKVGADVGTIEYENTNHSVLLGLRYHFAPPAPAASRSRQQGKRVDGEASQTDARYLQSDRRASRRCSSVLQVRHGGSLQPSSSFPNESKESSNGHDRCGSGGDLLQS